MALWDFDRVLWREYTTRFRDAVRDGDLTFDQQSRIQAIANEVHQAFDDVNALLNALAENAIPDGPSITRALAAARAALLRSVDNASKKLTKPYADFAPFVERAGRIARKVDKLLDKLRIPVFPAHADLGVLGPCIAPALYASLGGAQRFALLNIASRLQAITVNGRSLLDPAYDVKITRVFPDRIYLNAEAALIADIGGDAAQFAPAPAGLHRFRDGSFKGRHAREGNLQVSFATNAGGGRVDVDADIDLYRDPFRHLFGEVLVNHLTGRTTDQFNVQQILAGAADRADRRLHAARGVARRAHQQSWMVMVSRSNVDGCTLVTLSVNRRSSWTKTSCPLGCVSDDRQRPLRLGVVVVGGVLAEVVAPQLALLQLERRVELAGHDVDLERLEAAQQAGVDVVDPDAGVTDAFQRTKRRVGHHERRAAAGWPLRAPFAAGACFCCTWTAGAAGFAWPPASVHACARAMPAAATSGSRRR